MAMSTQKEARTINIRANTVHRIILGIVSQPGSRQTSEITPEEKWFYFQLHVGRRPTILP